MKKLYFVIVLITLMILMINANESYSAIYDPSDADNYTKLVADDNIFYKDDRIPIILIHGINGNAKDGNDSINNLNTNYFNELINYFNNHEYNFSKNYKIYRFHYVSNKYPVNEIARSFRNKLDSAIDSNQIADGKFVIVAHSMGGLVARSYMEQHSHKTGAYGGLNHTDGERGGERIIKLITLATPHHGSPLANNEPRIDFNVNPLWDNASKAADLSKWGLTSVNEPNRSDLRYDNHDGLWNNKPDEYQNDDQERNDWLKNMPHNYCSKIITYWGTIGYNSKVSLYGNKNASDMALAAIALSKYLYDYDKDNLYFAGVMLQRIYDNNFTSPVVKLENDGAVPKGSAAFDHPPSGHQIAGRVECRNHDHDQMKDGGNNYCENGLPLLENLEYDLLPKPVITDFMLMFSQGPYYVGEQITAGFTIKNNGGKALDVKKIYIGGLLGDDIFLGGCSPSQYPNCPNFPDSGPQTIEPGEQYTYLNSFTPTQSGNYTLKPIYSDYDERDPWFTNIPTVQNVQTKIAITVNDPPLPSTPYNLELTTQTIPSRASMLPSNPFTQTWTVKNTGSTTWGSDYKLEFVSGSDLMGGPSSTPVPRSVAKGDSVAISVNLTTPAMDGTYSGYWRMRAPNGIMFGPQLSAIINISSISGDFKIHDWVSAYGYIRTRDNANLNANLSCEGGKGDDGNIIDGPVVASALTWWKIKWDSGACKGVTGWSAQRDLNGNTQFQKIAYPAEGNIIRPKGTIFKYLYKNGRKWLFKDDNIFSKMGYSSADIKDIPSGMVGEFAFGLPPIIIDNGSIIRLKGDTKKYFLGLVNRICGCTPVQATC